MGDILLFRIHVYLAGFLNEVSGKGHSGLQYPRFEDRMGFPEPRDLVGASVPPKIEATEQATETGMPVFWEVKAKDDQGRRELPRDKIAGAFNG